MESAEQPVDDLHAKVSTSLKQLGHRVSTIPPQEDSVLADEFKEIARDLDYNAKNALEEAVSGGTTLIRTTGSKNPISIAKIRESLKQRFLVQKAA